MARARRSRAERADGAGGPGGACFLGMSWGRARPCFPAPYPAPGEPSPETGLLGSPSPEPRECFCFLSPIRLFLPSLGAGSRVRYRPSFPVCSAASTLALAPGNKKEG